MYRTRLSLKHFDEKNTAKDWQKKSSSKEEKPGEVRDQI